MAADDEIPSTVSQTGEPMEVKQEVVLPELSELNKPAMNNEKDYSRKRDSYHCCHATTSRYMDPVI